MNNIRFNFVFNKIFIFKHSGVVLGKKMENRKIHHNSVNFYRTVYFKSLKLIVWTGEVNI